MVASTDTRLVVFDGLCNVCSGGVRFLERHEIKPPFRLVPMQSDVGRALLAQHGYDPDDPLTFLVLDGDRCLTQSDATIHLMAAAGGVWRLVQVARLVPRALRDSLYGLVARNRYRWFGRRTTCYVPLPMSNCDSAGASKNPRTGEGSQTERTRRPHGGDGR